MSGTVEWSPKTVTEVVARYADFTDELKVGEAIPGGACLATVWSGNDSSPQNIIGTVTAITNSAGILAVVQVTVEAGVVGTLYQCLVTAMTNLGHTLTKTAVIAITPPLN